MKNYYELTKKLNINDVSFDGKANPADILNLFQQAMTLHTFEMGVDFESIRTKYNAKWFIVTVRLEIERAPRIDDTVVITTWPLAPSAVKFPRAVVMKDSRGNILAKAMTHWCIVDCDTGELLRTNVIAFPFDDFRTEAPTSVQPKIPMTDLGRICYSRKMLLSDIDINRHVNNVSYLRIALDCFSLAEFEKMDIASLDIHYKLQCFEGDALALYKKEQEDGSYIIDALRQEDTVFRVKIELK